MQEPYLSKDAAWRVALAAKALGDVSVDVLVGALHACLGESVDETSLRRLRVSDLKRALSKASSAPSTAALKDATRHLWGGAREIALPTPAAYADGDMPRSVRVAVASNDGEFVDGHFGSTSTYFIYQVSAQEIRLIDVREAERVSQAAEKSAARVELVRDCRILYAASIGGPASARVIKADIHIVQVKSEGATADLLKDLQRVISEAPPPWLAKALGDPMMRRLRYTAEEP